MSNPWISWIVVRDQYGTKLSDLGVTFNTSILRGNQIWAAPSEFIVQLMLMAASVSLYLLNLVTGHGFLLDLAARGYQIVLDSVYQVVNPLIVAAFAVTVLFARIYIGDKILVNKAGHVSGIQAHRAASYADEAFMKKSISQLGNTAILMAVIIVMMLNPFALLNFIFDAARALGGKLSGTGSTSVANVDGMVAPLLQMINYGEALGGTCAETWSRTLAAGDDVDKLDCLTAAQASAAQPGAVTVITAIVALVCVVGLAYFAWQVFKKATWFICRTMYFIFIVPWRAALLIANPGSERVKLDKIKDAFVDAFTSLFWLVVCVFIANAGPGILMMLARVAQTEAQLPAAVVLVLLSLAFYYCGKSVTGLVGAAWKKDARTGKWSRVEVGDGTAGWNDFFTNNSQVSWLSGSWDEARSAVAARRQLPLDDGVDENREGSPAGRGRAAVEVGVDPIVDLATEYVALTPPPATSMALVSRFRPGPGVAATTSSPSLPATEFIDGEVLGVTYHDNLRGVGGQGTPAPGHTGISSLSAVAEPRAAIGSRQSIGNGVSGGADRSASGPGRHQKADEGTVTPEHGGVHTPSVTGVGGDVVVERASDTTGSARQSDDPTTRRPSREALLADYREAISEVNDDGYADVVTSATTVRTHVAGDAVTSAFYRAQTGPEFGRSGSSTGSSGLLNGAGEFLDANYRDAAFREMTVLAKTLGLEPRSVIADSDDQVVQILFYSSTSDGVNEVRYRNQQGFGDDI